MTCPGPAKIQLDLTEHTRTVVSKSGKLGTETPVRGVNGTPRRQPFLTHHIPKYTAVIFTTHVGWRECCTPLPLSLRRPRRDLLGPGRLVFRTSSQLLLDVYYTHRTRAFHLCIGRDFPVLACEGLVRSTWTSGRLYLVQPRLEGTPIGRCVLYVPFGMHVATRVCCAVCRRWCSSRCGSYKFPDWWCVIGCVAEGVRLAQWCGSY